MLDREGVTADVIARSSPKTWLFKNDDSFLVEPQMLPQPEEGDYVGPQNLVVLLEGTFNSYFAGRKIPDKPDGTPAAEVRAATSPETRLVVTGSSVWAADALRNRLGYVLFANLVDWLSQDERLMSIRTRGIINRPLDLKSEVAKDAIKYGNMFFPPLAFVAFGVARWRWRLRSKRRGVHPILKKS
ncbi:MAG: hypothetical protein M5R36_01150 [Deltaproteobacteria bacterium]|nr:hypothetical protein [Deltaproteobacteria bacterium]